MAENPYQASVVTAPASGKRINRWWFGGGIVCLCLSAASIVMSLVVIVQAQNSAANPNTLTPSDLAQIISIAVLLSGIAMVLAVIGIVLMVIGWTHRRRSSE